MNIITMDFETSFSPNKPWLKGAYPVSLGILYNEVYYEYIINHSQEIPTFNPIEVQELFNKADVVIGHNLCFDLHWLRACGITLKKDVRLYDTMIAEYIIEGQSKTYEDLTLAKLSDKYLDTPKDDKVKTFWDAGYETADIPIDILLPYGRIDVENTKGIYDAQQPILEQNQQVKLVRLQSELVGVVQEMEWNGMKIDIEACAIKEGLCSDKIEELYIELALFIDDALPELRDIPIKWTSGDHLSVILFGGGLVYDGKEVVTKTIQESYQEEVEYITKKGFVKRKLLTKKRPIEKEYERKAKLVIKTEGLGFKPAKGTETKKEGFYQTDKAQLEQLKPKGKAQKRFLEIIGEISSAEKMRGTYFQPFQNESVDGVFHPSYNQTATTTGRLTCSRLHQIPRDSTAGVKAVFVSKYNS